MPQLDYATVPLAGDYKRINYYFRATLICSAAPIVIGYTILFLYWLTFRGWLTLVGCFVLCLGVISVLVGTCLFIQYVIFERGLAQAMHSRVRWRRIILASLLLSANLPAAWMGLGSAFYVGSFAYVDVINDSSAIIDNCDIQTPFGNYASGPIAPGKTFRLTTRHYYTRSSLKLEFRQGANHATATAPANDTWTRFHVKPGLTTTVDNIK